MKNKIFTSLIVLFLSGPALAEGRFIINPKIGLQSWADSTFTLGGNTIVFDDSIQAMAGVEGGYRFSNGFTVTAEAMVSDTEADSENGNASSANASGSYLMAMATYYFRSDKSFQPFIGVGAGTYSIEITDSNSNATLDGLSAQARIGGLIKITERISANVELKYYTFDVDDENNLAIKTDAYYLGGGATWAF